MVQLKVESSDVLAILPNYNKSQEFLGMGCLKIFEFLNNFFFLIQETSGYGTRPARGVSRRTQEGLATRPLPG